MTPPHAYETTGQGDTTSLRAGETLPTWRQRQRTWRQRTDRAAALRAASTTSRDWWDDRESLAELWRWLEERGDQPDDPAYYLDKPWKWDIEHEQMLGEQAARA